VSLVQLTEHLHIYRGGVNFAVITTASKDLLLVDTGLDGAVVRKAIRPFLQAGYQVKAILNTHSHADHIGGNSELVKRTGCAVWAPALEVPSSFTASPSS
jgi:glyoxylase-like metal-dependent hydrolase (beta-lactamase superfamily II)